MHDYPHSSKRFSLVTAHAMAESAALVYQPWSFVRKITEYIPGTFKSFDTDDTQVFILANSDRVIISFRGTEKGKVKDWQTDLNTQLIKAPFGYVHRGFKESFDHVWGSMLTFIRNNSSSDTPIWITGHSLGGALATVASMYMLLANRNIHGIYTFGSPRVGDETFGDYLDSQIKDIHFRFVNNEDIVTRVPPRVMRYSHVGTCKYFDISGKLHTGIGAWHKFLDRLDSIDLRSRARYANLQNRFPGGIDDHDMDQYIARLEKNMTLAQKRECGILSSSSLKSTDGFLNYINS